MTSPLELYSLDDIASETLDSYGDSSDVSRAKAYNAINRAIRIIARKGSWPFFSVEDETLTLTSGQETYFLKERIKMPNLLHLRDPARKVRMIDLRTLRRLYPNNTSTSGTPLFWRIVGFDENTKRYEIAFWPIPNGTYTVYVDAEQNPRLLTDKDDDLRSTGIPEEMIETVISLATALMFEKSADAKYEMKIAMAMQMLEDDWQRLGGPHMDDDMTAREYSGNFDARRDDPVLPPQFD